MALRNVRVRVPLATYPVCIGSGARERLVHLLRGKNAPSRLHLVSDERVYRHQGRRLEKVLRETGIPLSRSVVPAGEVSKSPRCLTRLWRDILSAGCDRSSCIVAFGGGMVGDLAGFAAASSLRGIDFVQVPTTLLAMVDASVGGKTGINLQAGKNLVGAFHQPRAVVMDLDFLETIPRREFVAGWAEVIKTAAIWSRRFFGVLERNREALLAREPEALGRAVESCVRIKAAVVAEDERESRLRMILNFGHTFGHGIEAAGRYRSLLHGEAVAIGMIFAARFGENLGYTQAGTRERLASLIEEYGLPTERNGLRANTVLETMRRDKKRGRKGLRWVFLPRIGEYRIVDDVPFEKVSRAVREFLKRKA